MALPFKCSMMVKIIYWSWSLCLFICETGIKKIVVRMKWNHTCKGILQATECWACVGSYIFLVYTELRQAHNLNTSPGIKWPHEANPYGQKIHKSLKWYSNILTMCTCLLTMVFVSPQHSYVKTYPPRRGIRKWGLWEVIRSWEWRLINKICTLIKEVPECSLALSAIGRHRRGLWSQASSLQNYEK